MPIRTQSATRSTIDELFPAIVAGDALVIQPGARIGRMRVRGTVTIEGRSSKGVRIGVACRVLGVRSNGSIDVDMDREGRVAITVHGLPFLAIAVTGVPRDLRADRLLLAVDPAGSIDVAGGADELTVTATGLRVGDIDVRLVRTGD